MIRRLAAVLFLAALAGCGLESTAPVPGYAEGRPRTTPFGGPRDQQEALLDDERPRRFRNAEAEWEEPAGKRRPAPDEELVIIERKKLGYPAKFRGAEMWAVMDAHIERHFHSGAEPELDNDQRAAAALHAITTQGGAATAPGTCRRRCTSTSTTTRSPTGSGQIPPSMSRAAAPSRSRRSAAWRATPGPSRMC